MDQWQIWIDTGGTFTDCIARNPAGNFQKVKVLSSSSLRGTITEWHDEQSFLIDHHWGAPDNFIAGFKFKLLNSSRSPVKVAAFDAAQKLVTLERPLPAQSAAPFEVIAPMEAPILAARLATSTPAGRTLPPIDLRLATTKGTNALLEQKGAPTLLLITEGFADLLKIGDQKRPDLFALHIEKPRPVYDKVIEVPERIDAAGNVVRPLDRDLLLERLQSAQNIDEYSVALCLMNSYKNNGHEQAVSKILTQLGARHVSVSSELSPFIKILSRAQTAVVNAYLAPIMQQYIYNVREQLSVGSFRMMTSAGGLTQANRFNPKDSLLSGPAGGVVGAATTGKQAGYKNLISFDMGGTSTDVARYDGAYDYLFQHQVGDARLAAPALSIETVAAGGGSICAYDGFKLAVGPESAGANPGPACYGNGGPLTVTDVNLLLGRLDPKNFSIPVSINAAEEQFENILGQMRQQSGQEVVKHDVLEGFLQIANERMADAIRKISLQKGYDPQQYAIVAFGGAGAQHACAIADQLEVSDIIIPADAGLLSAYGLGNAVIEQFEEEPVLEELSDFTRTADQRFRQLSGKAIQHLADEGIPREEIHVRRKSAFLRLEGQESTLELTGGDPSELPAAFKKAYKQRYGHWIDDHKIEVESIRVVASTRKPKIGKSTKPNQTNESGPASQKPVIFNGDELETPVYTRDQLSHAVALTGPAIILDPYSTIIVQPGWQVQNRKNGTLVLQRSRQTSGKEHRGLENRSEAVALELFTNRFTSVAEEMGEMLKRTALSVNVKERMDYSCALLNAEGSLIVNAPHIPVHLGALGLCIRRLKETITMQPGDVVATNHPAFGGSHLPDVTVVTPIFTDEQSADPTLIGFAASRAHHAEIGGTRPGSMPPDAKTLAEEGVVISPMKLVKKGNPQWEKIRKLLTEADHPTRNIQENIADLQAAVAANHRGAQSLLTLIETHDKDRVLHYMDALKAYAADKMRTTIGQLENGTYQTREQLDDGTALHATITIDEQHITFNLEGTDPEHPGNLNATPAIVNSVIIYILRLLVEEPLPLNEGLLEPVTIILPEGTFLNPVFSDDPHECPAVVGGNIETSQRLVDLLLKPFEKIACSQGTMNNVLFGNDSFGYYETIGGGTGAGADFNGSDAVHHHMTNTAGTDPEILEQRYPVRLDQYAVRENSGGDGKHTGGNGILRKMTFLEPVSLSVLTQHRVEAPYGLQGGKPGAKGQQWVTRADSADGTKQMLHSIDGADLQEGDQFTILTPGGGGYGKPGKNKNSP